MNQPVVGMVGGGQLARMTHQAGIALGVRFRLLADSPDDSAAQAVRDVVLGDYRDLGTLRRFAADCDVVTFDHEHVPTEHLRALEEAGTAVRPGTGALTHAQDKVVMRERLTAAGIPCPAWAPVNDEADLVAFAGTHGWPVVVKTARGGYDGKGVWVVDSVEEARPLLAEAATRGLRLLAEERVDFVRELSALVARSPHGQAAAYPVVETVQRDGICHEVIAPAPGLPAATAVAAQDVALRIAEQLGVVGVMAVEMFQTADPDRPVLVNELAMRPHNSGHWTIEGARTSQFEQHLRAVLDLPLGEVRTTAPWTVMVNVLGGDVGDLHYGLLHCFAHDPGVRIHLYGKTVRPGRKVGHVTVCGEDLEDVRERARHAAAYLRGDIDG